MKWAQKQKGFTIVELLIVIVVIAILATITIVSFSGIQQQARDSVRKSDAALIAKALQLWSYNTRSQYDTMNSGNARAANGWFDGSYGGTPSVRSVLVSSGFSGMQNMDDPNRSTDSAARWRYMIAPCTDTLGDNRRVVLVELEQVPSQTVLQQLSGHGCNSTFLTSYPASYKVNYAQMADAR